MGHVVLKLLFESEEEISFCTSKKLLLTIFSFMDVTRNAESSIFGKNLYTSFKFSTSLIKNIYYLAAKYLNWGALGCQPESKWNSQWEVAHRIRKF